MITKIATQSANYSRNWKYHDSARNAWREIIESYKRLQKDGIVLLPAYIGWSANEGSGIFDAVSDAGIDYDFYNLNGHLEIDVPHLKQKIGENKNPLVLLVHYFGFTDKSYNPLTQWLTAQKIFFVEDCAHAWLSDLIGGVCGRKGNCSFYSLHKLLPLKDGGILADNFPTDIRQGFQPYIEMGYDLHGIYEARRDNYSYLVNLLKNVHAIEIIYPELPDGVCPQTLPAIVKNYDRNQLYFEMNAKGFGLVSLYHTMIKELADSEAESASQLSKNIINFPVHQDISKGDMEAMVQTVKIILNA